MIYAWRFDFVSNEDCVWKLGVDENGLYLEVRPSNQKVRK